MYPLNNFSNYVLVRIYFDWDKYKLSRKLTAK